MLEWTIIYHTQLQVVEGYFNDIKTRLQVRPMRVDKFLMKHAQDIHGATLLFSSRMINFNAKRCELTANLMENENKINEQFRELHSMSENIGKRIQFSLLKTSKNQRNDIEMRTNDIKSSCNLNLTKNWPGKSEHSDQLYDQLLNSDDVSHFVEKPSSDIEAFIDSDLQAQENWRGKVEVNNNFNFENPDDLKEEILNDCNAYENVLSLTDLPREEIMNIESLNASLFDLSYASTNISITDLLSSTIDLQNSNHIKYENSLTEKSESSSIPLTSTLDLKSKEKLQVYKSKKLSKYFQPYPKIRQINTLVKQNKKSVMLPHGSLCPPIKINEKGEMRSYSVTNTCVFDFVVHVLMTAGIEDINYCAYMKASSNSAIRIQFNSKWSEI